MTLNRPELLNRIGENVIVFDFIRSAIAEQILEVMVSSLLADLRAAQGLEIMLAVAAAATLRHHRLPGGPVERVGRGIRNQLESHLLNPLARALFDLSAGDGDCFEITAIDAGEVTTLTLARVPGSPA